MSWTDERVALLKKLWGEGRTAAEIAAELGSVTRNAVIGKAHRLKLSNRVSPIQQNKKQASRPPTQAAVAEKKIQRIIEQDNARVGVSMMKLGARMCRWPLGDPQDENFGFCGDTIAEGLPYCEDHARVAYQAAGKARVLQAEDFEEKAKDTGSDEESHGIKVASNR